MKSIVWSCICPISDTFSRKSECHAISERESQRHSRHPLYSPDLKLVPLLVGSVSPSKVEQLAPVLAELWNDPETFFVISSDFCHW